MNTEQALRKYLGIGKEDINAEKLTDLLIDSFVYHEGMADVSIDAIKSKSADDSSSKLLWESFETNNALAYAMRSLLLKASEVE